MDLSSTIEAGSGTIPWNGRRGTGKRDYWAVKPVPQQKERIYERVRVCDLTENDFVLREITNGEKKGQYEYIKVTSIDQSLKNGRFYVKGINGMITNYAPTKAKSPLWQTKARAEQPFVFRLKRKYNSNFK